MSVTALDAALETKRDGTATTGALEENVTGKEVITRTIYNRLP